MSIVVLCWYFVPVHNDDLWHVPHPTNNHCSDFQSDCSFWKTIDDVNKNRCKFNERFLYLCFIDSFNRRGEFRERFGLVAFLDGWGGGGGGGGGGGWRVSLCILLTYRSIVRNSKCKHTSFSLYIFERTNTRRYHHFVFSLKIEQRPIRYIVESVVTVYFFFYPGFQLIARERERFSSRI